MTIRSFDCILVATALGCLALATQLRTRPKSCTCGSDMLIEATDNKHVSKELTVNSLSVMSPTQANYNRVMESWREVVGWRVTESWEQDSSQCKGPEAETCLRVSGTVKRHRWLESSK